MELLMPNLTLAEQIEFETCPELRRRTLRVRQAPDLPVVELPYPTAPERPANRLRNLLLPATK
jgi:hypothetical protein